MKRLMLAAAIAASTLALPAAVAAGEPMTCDYDATSHEVNVVIMGDHGVGLQRDVAGHINFNSVWCDGATVTNTNSVVVTGDTESQAITISLANKGFRPGFTNEPGKSDEIEFTINMGGGSDDYVFIEGGTAGDKIDLGQKTNIFGVVRRVNFNAGEKTGIDLDISIVQTEHITVVGGGGNDVIRARGKAATGPDPVTLSLNIYGGDGDDTLKGGEASDQIYGDSGKDTIWGYGTGDTIYMNDGEIGDVGYGGAGIDHAFSDPGDTFVQ